MQRAFIAETAYAVLRRKRLLERLAGPRPTPRQLVLLSLSRVRGMSQRQLDPALQEGEAEWLAGIRRGAEPDLTAAEQADLPDWLVERLLSRMTPQALQTMAPALNSRASASVVLPAPPWPTRATARMDSVLYLAMMQTPFSYLRYPQF